ncbi:Gamma interferon inducible lysosomal thiol reductase GILT [Dillenia turbinata]|uniref:Gamma interferon inducible lysosomal thiol reductase GILT n=1 Tax=Dillenia turbinata TaxID=194707 RepID=A0AAN8W127_9MAGN
MAPISCLLHATFDQPTIPTDAYNSICHEDWLLDILNKVLTGHQSFRLQSCQEPPHSKSRFAQTLATLKSRRAKVFNRKGEKMASYKLFSPTAFCVLLLLLASKSHCSPSTGSEIHSSKKVSLNLYYESLCPACTEFILGPLSTIFENGIIDIVNLSKNHAILVTKINILKYDVILQHGDDECRYNFLEGCVIHSYPKPIAVDYYKETKSLKPPRKFVPWVTVNGAPLGEDYENFIYYVCNEYKGKSLPKVCELHKTAEKITEKSNSVHQQTMVDAKDEGKRDLALD